jgi:exopolyphosphatase/guanosine-5'-triphosphate,3'-diphosphate pyrophosphatase
MTSALATAPEAALEDNDIERLRQRSAEALMALCDCSEAHATHVAALAVRLAEQLANPLLFGQEEISMLRYGALLHDIGWHFGQNKHHRNSYRLIKSGRLLGFSLRQIETIALIARYHRKSAPKLSHRPYARLDSMGRQTVLRLAAVLRIADGLDRTHRSAVEDVLVQTGPGRVRLLVRSRLDDVQTELWAADRKKKLLEIAMGRPVSLSMVNLREANHDP